MSTPYQRGLRHFMRATVGMVSLMVATVIYLFALAILEGRIYDHPWQSALVLVYLLAAGYVIGYATEGAVGIYSGWSQ